MLYVLAFFNGTLTTALVALVAHGILSLVTHDRPTSLGTMCCSAGYAVGRFSFAGDIDDPRLLPSVCGFGGATLVVICLAVRHRRDLRAGSGD